MGWRDLPEVITIDQASFSSEAWSSSLWWAELATRPQRHYVVATSENRSSTVLGYLGCDARGDVVDIMTIAVAPDARGTGVAQALLGWCFRHGLSVGAETVILEVKSNNHAALRCYEQAGFQEISRRRRYYQPAGIDALILRRSLSDPEPSPRSDQWSGQPQEESP